MAIPVGSKIAQLPDATTLIDPASFILLLAMEHDEEVDVHGVKMTARDAMKWLVRSHENGALPTVAHRRTGMIELASALARVTDHRAKLSPQYATAFICRLRRIEADAPAGKVEMRMASQCAATPERRVD